MESLAELLALTEYEVGDLGRAGGRHVVGVRPKGKVAPPCPYCGHAKTWRHGKRSRYVSHASLGRESIDLDVTFERFRCPSCGKTHTPKLPEIGRRARISDRLKSEILDMVHYFKCAIQEAAKWIKVSWGTVWRALSWERPPIPRPCGSLDKLKNLCIDEVFFRSLMRFLTVLSDADRSTVLGVVPGKGYKPARKLLLSLPLHVRERIDTLSTDFASGHKKAGYKFLPNVLVVADRFHLARIARRAIIHSSKEERELAIPAVRELRRLLDAGGRRGLAMLADWLSYWRKAPGIPANSPLASLVSLVDEWQMEIEGYLETGCSNGVAEAINRKIALLRRKACGYTNPANFIRRIFCLNPSLHPES